MPSLFAVLLGGRAERCNTELHDVVFIVANSLEEAYPRLVHKWFGHSKRLHIDSSVELKYVDGYEISLSKEVPIDNDKTLFFVNFGGYEPKFFGEIHHVNFYVCAQKTEAVVKAKQSLCVGLHLQHCDDNLEVNELIDDLIPLKSIDNYYIHLKPTTHHCELEVISDYRKLDVPHIIEKAKSMLEMALI